MCGVTGYIGKQQVSANVIASLKEMEYRGYDSAGIAIINPENTFLFKEVGKLDNLINAMKDFNYNGAAIAIGHTRWATHGGVSKVNAHPHQGEHALIVHNGIIENYAKLKTELLQKQINFVSDTDTEVIVHLFELLLKEHGNDPLKALKATISRLLGAFALLLITPKFNQQIFFAKKNSPLVIGFAENEVQIVSSSTAFNNNIKKIYHLNDGDFGYLKQDSYKMFNGDKEIIPKFLEFNAATLHSSKDNFNYFMEKEILEQHIVLQNTIKSRLTTSGIQFNELPADFFNGVNRIILCACGTSFHAGLAGSYLLERYAKIIATPQIASEFHYKSPVLTKNDLVIFISQSGETADTLASLKYCKNLGIKTLVISNVEGSSLVRESPAILTNIGIEKSVASTKAFSSQVLVLWMLTLYLAQKNNSLDKPFMQKQLADIKNAIAACEATTKLNEDIKNLVNSLNADYRFLFLGRDIFYPLALEGALKLKEITYLSAEGYPAGEMKHGPIAIADKNLCTIALTPINLLYEKTKSNIIEIASRNSKIVNISANNFNSNYSFIKTIATDSYMVEFFKSMVILQLFAMHTAIKLKKDVDMPRNLAKSVTVE